MRVLNTIRRVVVVIFDAGVNKRSSPRAESMGAATVVLAVRAPILESAPRCIFPTTARGRKLSVPFQPTKKGGEGAATASSD
jgi:hypothetical protein